MVIRLGRMLGDKIGVLNIMLELNYENCLTKSIGSEGISEEKLAVLIEEGRKVLGNLKKDSPGFMKLPFRFDIAQQIVKEAEPYKKFKNLVILGIGGSALGNITLQNALNHPYYNLKEDRNTPRVFVLDNVDSNWTKSLADIIKPEETVFNVITKSGSTAETLANFFYFLKKLKSATNNWKDHLVFTTGEKGFLRDFANEHKIKTYPVPEDVGGRFSVLSEVGLFPAALCGIDIIALLEGASDAAENEHVPINYAALQYYFYKKGKNISVFMPYSKKLESTADWFRQLWAESLGKNENTGPTPVKALGTTDQHSQVQLYMEGPKDKVITFLNVNDESPELKLDFDAHFLGDKSVKNIFSAENHATIKALTQVKRPNMSFEIPEINAYNIGGLIYQLETACCIMGYMLNINPFDQPGVELGKKLTYEILGKK